MTFNTFTFSIYAIVLQNKSNGALENIITTHLITESIQQIAPIVNYLERNKMAVSHSRQLIQHGRLLLITYYLK